MTKEEALKKIEELKEYVKKCDENKKLYELVSYCNMDWYIIKERKDTYRLMSKNVIDRCTYSDNNSNDWVCSNARKKARNFVGKILHAYNLIKMTTNYDENKFCDDFIRIPTLREIEALPMEIRDCGEAYWTMTSSYGVSENCSYAYVFLVDWDGNLTDDSVDDAFGVRLVIEIRKDRLLN